MSRDRVTLGEIGEKLACDALEHRGYAILARRYRRRGGEIDIIALDRATVVFVEVKTRAGAAYGSGAEAITPTKRRRIIAVATDFIARQRLHECQVRFDVVAVDLTEEGPRIEVYPGAFDASG